VFAEPDRISKPGGELVSFSPNARYDSLDAWFGPPGLVWTEKWECRQFCVARRAVIRRREGANTSFIVLTNAIQVIPAEPRQLGLRGRLNMLGKLVPRAAF
jgi:hypothetical protein